MDGADSKLDPEVAQPNPCRHRNRRQRGQPAPIHSTRFSADVRHRIGRQRTADLLGHKHISTTQIYTAVFDEELVRSFRTFLDARRAQRPEDEYRSPTDAEWNEFQQHFEHRKLELGTCGRPYNTPCKHEHACIRCPSQQVDPNARVRLTEIIANLRDRIAEARNNGWTGEAEGLQTSLTAGPNAMTSLGIPAMP
jgi:hypothetical protein